VWYCVSEDFSVTILCYNCYKYRNHKHLKIIDHMNRITIYVHDITEHYPENVLSGLKKEVERYVNLMLGISILLWVNFCYMFH